MATPQPSGLASFKGNVNTRYGLAQEANTILEYELYMTKEGRNYKVEQCDLTISAEHPKVEQCDLTISAEHPRVEECDLTISAEHPTDIRASKKNCYHLSEVPLCIRFFLK